MGGFDWTASTWARMEGRPSLVPPRVRAEWLAMIDGVPEDTPVRITAGMLRALLDASAPAPTARGAQITDHDRGVTYYATIYDEPGPAKLRTVEIVPLGPRTDPRAYRVPVQALADQVAYMLASPDDGDPAGVIGWDEEASTQPTPETLRLMLAQGLKRKDIAERYGRSLPRVDQWLRAAREARPELNWPTPRGGGRPKKSGGSVPPVTEKENEMESGDGWQ